MELEEQVCSLELAKRLKELGVPQESLWYWWEWYTDKYKIVKYDENLGLGGTYKLYSAFTVAELGEMLPKGFRSGKMEHGLFKVYNKNPMYEPKGTGEIRSDTEANARAKMYIYLIENKLAKL